MNNITSDTTVVLGFPLPETNIIRTINQSLTSLTITLPTVTANERGMLFNFFKSDYVHSPNGDRGQIIWFPVSVL